MATNIAAPQSDDQPPSADPLVTVVPPSQRKQIQEIAQLINNLNAGVHSAMLALIVNHHHARTPNKCHLLALPAELRVKIFEYSLRRSNTIKVDSSGLSVPGLLSVSIRVRNEAIYIYYSTSRFRIVVHDCNIEPVVPFVKNLQNYFKIPRDYHIRKPEVGLVKISLRCVPNWPSLMKWIRLSYSREISWWFIVDVNTIYRDKKRVWNVFTTARKMKIAGLPWETARGVLRTLRANLKEADPRW
ncbi:hypothetical protein LTR56_005397 [Elasticomyces elasticus]|nr:hypothetical protein LTR22_020628 [Elasticomyces elasticus]KAK3651889.1 hypothetical protein LTR56_005397 [Elasticomyces elasticus]KAK4927784.1 hypothetical protein LTR49_005409 [Elasticomyces elasticus]KAK5761455.1 hypothetical protein LTS12_008417 [Elasticomyces elasticus]